MIGALRGNIIAERDGRVVVDVAGVGYDVWVTKSVLAKQSNSEVQLVVHTEVRENDISLFGFTQSLEREVFLLLKQVKGIGPKLAMCILSELGAEAVLAGVGQGNAKIFQSVSGVGKKTAERIALELREQVDNYRKEETLPQVSVESDVIQALEKLGFQSEKAKGAVTTAIKASGNSNDSGEILRTALANLS